MPHQQAPERPESQEEKLELRPIVKYLAIGLGVLSLLGVEYATYRAGVERGYQEGVCSGEVTAAVHACAVENLRHVLQLASAEDAVLVDAVKNHRTTLAWIKEPTVLYEVQWALAQALITRGLAAEADSMLRELFSAQQQASPLWARRALVTARALVEEGKYEQCAHYYGYAEAYYKSVSLVEKQLEIISEQLTYLPTAYPEPQKLQQQLAEYSKRAAELGDKGAEMVAGIWAWKGRLYREEGTTTALEKANRCFEKALSGFKANQLPELAGASICVGSLLLDKGESERAEELIKNGLSRIEDTPSAAPYMLLALRDLARIEQDKGNSDAALAMLYRAEGIALIHEPAGSTFWNCLYDQRGWLNFRRENYGAARVDFEKALEVCGDNPAYRVQPLEGAARCCLAYEEIEKAAEYFNECLQLRRAHMATELVPQGRIQLELARIYDAQNKAEEACAAYGEAVSLLSTMEDKKEPELISAMFARAYSLTQLRHWTEAYAVWEALQPLVADDKILRNEISVQMQYCREKGVIPAAEESH